MHLVTDATPDAPILPCLLDQIPADEPVVNKGSDGAYCAKAVKKQLNNVGLRLLSPFARTLSYGRTFSLAPAPVTPS